MNWTKTFLHRIGAPDADADVPPPPDPDPTDIPFYTDTIRTLGIYVGTDDQITQAWKSHITHKMKTRFDLWRRRGASSPTLSKAKTQSPKTVSLPVSGTPLNTNHPPTSTPS